MYLLYTAALALGLVATLPYYGVRFRKYLPTMRERMGFVPRLAGKRPIWIHAVSVGELRAVDPLIRSLHQFRPDQPVVLSTTTPSGRALAEERDDIVRVTYFPLDLPRVVNRMLERLRPEIVIVAETEIWPNFLRRCRQLGIPVFMVNGRISDRSFARYRLGRRWLRRVLADYAILGMQSQHDAERILELGATGRNVRVLGNLKYDGADHQPPLDESLCQALETSQPLIVAASTARGEEQLVIDAFQRVAEAGSPARLLIAPRRAEQFDEVCRAVERTGLRYWRRSSGSGPPEGCRVLVLDTIGELSRVFEFAAVVFMGGTLVPRGGHNILEPVRLGKPVIFGPHMDNFRDMAREFVEREAAIEISTSHALAGAFLDALDNPEKMRIMTSAASGILADNRGATRRTIDAIFGALEAGSGGTGPRAVAGSGRLDR